MGKYQKITKGFFAAALTAIAMLSIAPSVKAQSFEKGIQMKVNTADSNAVTTMSEAGVPERGRFQFIYTYIGEPLSKNFYMDISLNGSMLKNFTSLSPASNVMAINKDIKKGDKVNLYVGFYEEEATLKLHTGLVGYTPGFWAGSSYVTFYLKDPTDGSIIRMLGRMYFTFYQRPPWNGITVTAEPENLSSGEAANITLQPYEAPGEPVILPDVTYINLQTSFLGDLIGGLSLPEYGFRYTQGFVNAPWGLLKSTEILYEVHPSIKTSSPIHIPVYAYSPYDASTLGITTVEVGEEEELELTLTVSETQTWPTLVFGTAGEGSKNPNPNDRNKIKQLKIQVTKNEEPAKNKHVVIKANMILPSGGHEHTNMPALNDLGIFKDLSTGKTGAGRIGTTTNEEGIIVLEYTAPKISGEFAITAYLKSNKAVKDSSHILVRVPKLVNFAKLGEEHWNLTGNVGTTSYSKCSGSKIKHYKSHFASTELFVNLNVALQYFYDWSGTPREEGGFGNFLKLGINDMSLPKGGIFDICSDWGVRQGISWKKGHFYHRIGASVDIDTRAVVVGENRSIDLLTTKLPNGKTLVEKLTFYIERLDGSRYEEATIHYGFGGN